MHSEKDVILLYEIEIITNDLDREKHTKGISIFKSSNQSRNYS